MENSSATQSVSHCVELEATVLNGPVGMELNPELVRHGFNRRIWHVHTTAFPNDGGVWRSSVPDHQVIFLTICRRFHIETCECKLEPDKQNNICIENTASSSCYLLE